MQVKVLLDPESYSEADGVSPDLIASATHRVPLSGLLKVTQEKTPRHGDVVLARVKKVNTDYSLLETLDGEEETLVGGELLIGVLGTRKALHGFSGDPPSELKPGMELHLLNRGGVIGECSAFHRDLGWPTQLEYLGTVSLNDQPANLQDYALPMVEEPALDVPVVLIMGTCMNAGKTAVCRKLLKVFTEKGFSVNAGKVAGVGCLRDTLAMKKDGAQETLSFQDFGLPSTAHLETVAPIARSMIHYLSESRPDFIIIEMGDGVLGGYQVASLFDDEKLMESCMSMVVCANDLMGVWGAMEWLSKRGERKYPILISGRVTDSAEGVRYIERNWDLPAGNAQESTGKICEFILESLMPWLKSE